VTQDFFKLTDKVAIAWGGGLGMGERSAIRLAEAGCHVAVVDVERERAERVCAEIRALGRRAAPFVADITDEEQVIATVAAAERELGPVDCMVTVVGMAFWKPLLDVSAEDWEKAFAVNLKSFFFTARAVARSLIAHDKPGSIVGVCSVSGLQSGPQHGPYAAAKAGLANLVRTMAVEWGPNIRVNAIAPGAIRTPRLNWTDEAAAMFKDRVGLGRPGETDEIGKAALFLASDLSSYVTGHTLPVDGGWMAEYLIRRK
jgi:NAD(P)-dependent dehydrogenase (short-subunit alcohol dehydrogenase family)